MQTDTIAAISTPPGRGGIGIVRLAGQESVAIASKLLHNQLALSDPANHARTQRVQVLDPSEMDLQMSDSLSRLAPQSGLDARILEFRSVNPRILDDALLTVFHAPHSYTGDTLVEIAAHGSPVVLEAILRGALAGGARLAVPGEFTQRAFLAGKLDLTQAEAVHDLIAAQTLEQARTAARQMGGALAGRVAPAKEALLELIARLEAAMDFATGELDDVDLVPAVWVAAGIMAARAPLAALAAGYRRGMLRRNGAALALVGPPNVGKSSLFNRLLARERAIVTAIPGTTRDTLEEAVELGGVPLRLIDTAGLREAQSAIDEAERMGMLRSREALADADLVLQVHDVTQPWTAEELAILHGLQGQGDPALARPYLLIANKIDLNPVADEAMAPGGMAEAIPTSAVTEQGLDILRSAILRMLGAETSDSADINTLRQQQAVEETLAALDRAAEANAAGLPHEILLLELHAALVALDSLTGVTTTDDILARIFSTFCIGK